MTALPTYFDDFLENIRLTGKLREASEKTHQELSVRLEADESTKGIIIGDFLQGSYARHTGVRPAVQGGHVDVDLVVVTSLSQAQYSPQAVVERFRPFLNRSYPNQWKPNDRSIRIEPTGSLVTLDFVATSAPSQMQIEVFKSLTEARRAQMRMPENQRMEARGDRGTVLLTEALTKMQKAVGLERWQQEPLLIPARDLQTWEPTHPLEQIRWTVEKNRRTNGHYVNVVKAIKWWWTLHTDAVYPKGYPLEHLVGQTCSDGIDSVAIGVVRVFEEMRDNYKMYATMGMVPNLPDHGVPQHNVLERITPEQFAIFWRKVERAASEARAALDALTTQESGTRWRALLGVEFPAPPKTPAFVPPTRPAQPTSGGRFG